MIKQFVSLAVLFILCSSCGLKAPESEYKFITEPSTGDPILLNSGSRSRMSLMSLSGESATVNNSIFKGINDCTGTNELVSSARKSGRFDWTSKKGRRIERLIELDQKYTYLDCDKYSEQGTYEHAASTVMNFLKRTENLVLQQTDLKLPKVKVRVVPLVKLRVQKVSGKVVRKQDQYLVNNAFFMPSNRELVFLPQGRDSFGRVPFSGVPLWNIPFVVSHEYGHHIFNELLGSKVSKKAHICFKSDGHIASTSKSAKPATNKKLISAVNEAFADIVGQLASGDNFSFDGINCFEKSRDLSSPRFFDRTNKVLNGHFLNEFLRPSPRKIFSCGQTNYSEIHHFGAIIAYGIYQTMKQSKLKNLKVITDWAKDFNLKFKQHLSVKENLEIILSSFVDVSIESKVESKELICNSMKEYFPVFDFNKSCDEL